MDGRRRQTAKWGAAALCVLIAALWAVSGWNVVLVRRGGTSTAWVVQVRNGMAYISRMGMVRPNSLAPVPVEVRLIPVTDVGSRAGSWRWAPCDFKALHTTVVDSWSAGANLWVLLVGAAGGAAWLRHAGRPAQAGECPRCRYDLAGNTNGVCPECGSADPRAT